jgi:hypothetical protein
VKRSLIIFNSNIRTAAFVNCCSRRILNIRWTAVISKKVLNTAVWEKTNGNQNKKIEIGLAYAKEDTGLGRKGNTGLDSEGTE